MAIQEAHPKQLKAALNRFDARLRLVQSIAWLPRGIAAGLTVAGALAVAARLRPLLPTSLLLPTGAILVGIGVAVAWLVIWLWRRSPLQRARRFDQALKLKERLSTALEIERGDLRVDDAWIADAQRADAISIAASTHASDYLRLRVDWRDWALAAIVGGLLAIAVILPNPQDNVLAEQAAVEQAVTEQLVALENLREEVLTDPEFTTAERAEIAQTLEEAILTLGQPGVSQEEAVAALDQAENQLRDMSMDFAEQRQQALTNLSAQFSDAGVQDTADALSEGDFSGAGQTLSGDDQSLSDAIVDMTPQEQAALADQLQSISDQLADSNPDVSQALSDVADALQNGDTAAAQEALNEAAQAMEDTGMSSSSATDAAADKTQKSGAAVAQAGGNTTNQPGEGSMGQAQALQPGEGQGEGQSSDVQQMGGGTTAGRGEDEGVAAPSLAGSDVGTNEPGDGGETPYDDVYAPQRIGGEGGEQVDIPGQPDSGIPNRQGEFVDNPSGESSVGYSSVYASYEGQVNEALDSGYIPLGMRDLIQSYFSRLDPGE
jgi:hypothetical protein